MANDFQRRQYFRAKYQCVRVMADPASSPHGIILKHEVYEEWLYAKPIRPVKIHCAIAMDRFDMEDCVVDVVIASWELAAKKSTCMTADVEFVHAWSPLSCFGFNTLADASVILPGCRTWTFMKLPRRWQLHRLCCLHRQLSC